MKEKSISQYNLFDALCILSSQFRTGCEGALLAISENDCRQLEQTIYNLDNNMTLQENQGIIDVYGT